MRGRIMLLLVNVALASAARVVFQVDPRDEMCLFEEFSANFEVSAQLMVVRGGKLDIKFRILGPDSGTLFEQLVYSNIDDRSGAEVPLTKKGHVWVTTQSGPHKFCFDNTQSQRTAKVVSFEITSVDRTAAPVEGGEDVAADLPGKPAPLSVMEKTAQLISAKLLEIEGLQRYHYTREQRHRDTGESNNARVMWFAILEAVVLVGASATELVIVRRWFKSPLSSSRV